MADLEWKTDITEKDSSVQGTVDDDSDEDGSVSSHEIVGKKARKRRRRACGVCPGCVREDCGRCSNCRDMVKFGGTGCKKKRCIRRRCTPPVSIDPMPITSFFNSHGNTQKSPSLSSCTFHSPVVTTNELGYREELEENEAIDGDVALCADTNGAHEQDTVMAETTCDQQLPLNLSPSASQASPSSPHVTPPLPPPPLGSMSQTVLNWDTNNRKLSTFAPPPPLQSHEEQPRREKENAAIEENQAVQNGKRRRQRNGSLSSAKLSCPQDNENVCSDCVGEENGDQVTSLVQSTNSDIHVPLQEEASGRRTRRKAAIEADKKFTETTSDADSSTSSPLVLCKVARKRKKRSFLNSSDEEQREEETKEDLDTSACMITDCKTSKGDTMECVQSSVAITTQALTESLKTVAPSSTTLSAGWASLFRKPQQAKEEPGDARMEEVVVHDETRERKKQSTPSPKKCQSPRKMGSPFRSPSKSSLHTRRSSPKHSSPLRRRLVGHDSPQKSKSALVFTSSSLSSRKQLSFEATCKLDHAPFNGLVHVRQYDGLDLPVHSLPTHKHHSALSSAAHNVSKYSMPLGTVTMANMQNQLQMTQFKKEEVGQNLSVLDILKQIEERSPKSIKVQEMFSRYKQLTQSIGSSTTSNVNHQSRQHPRALNPSCGSVTKAQDKSFRNAKHSRKSAKDQTTAETRETRGYSLVCSIRVKKRRRQGARILVDPLPYADIEEEEEEEDQQQVGRRNIRRSSRHSLRLAKTEEAKAEIEWTPDKQPSKPSRRRKASDDIQIVSTQEGEQCCVVSPIVSSSLGYEGWCDVYQPHRAAHVIGNQSAVHQLQSWLSQWKEKCQAAGDVRCKPSYQNGDQSKPSYQNGDQSKPHISSKTSNSQSDEDPDFETTKQKHRPRMRPPRLLSLDDSFDSADLDGGDEDERGLCPALLLCGPSGSGKTAAAMACAEELGFNVLEVNSTQLRSKQYLLTTLREATQSHQVTSSNTSIPSSSTSSTSLPPTSTKPSGLFAFFKSQPAPETGKTKKNKDKKKEETLKRDKSGGDGGDREIPLATITVIILEEVDILFEDERRGFWTTVYELLATTKRPFILTANDSALQLDGPFKKIEFVRPSCDEVSINCQLLSLAHGVYMHHNLANQIAVLLSCDLRKVFNLLHFWIARSPPPNMLGSDHVVDTLSTNTLFSVLGVSPAAISVLVGTPSPPHNEVKSCVHHDFALLSHGIEQLNRTTETHCYEKRWTSLLASSSFYSSSSSSASTDELIKSKPGHHQVKCANTMSLKTLDQIAHLSDTYSLMDIMPSSISSSSSLSQVTPVWWSTEPQSSLLDEFSTAEQEPVSEEWVAQYRSCMEACIFSLSSTWFEHNPDTITYNLDCHDDSRSRHVHCAQMCCCEVFGVQNEMSRVSMATECLPYLHLICRSEQNRCLAGTKRRFLHYLHNSHVGVESLNNFSSVCSLAQV